MSSQKDIVVIFENMRSMLGAYMPLVATGRMEDAFDKIPLHVMVIVEAFLHLGSIMQA